MLAACGEKASVPNESPRTTGLAESPPTATSGTTVRKSPTSDTLEISGEWRGASEGSLWTAYAIQGRVSRIDENWLPSGDTNSKRVMLYDEAGKVVRISEERHQLVANPSSSPSLLNMVMRIDFAGAGGVRSNKVVDGVERPVQSWDIDNARRHANELLALARKGLPAH